MAQASLQTSFLTIPTCSTFKSIRLDTPLAMHITQMAHPV
jgi:hypothetical protein